MLANTIKANTNPASAHSDCSRRAAKPRERGTALLMVIGVLALLAIIAIAYATLGRADRFTSAVSMSAQRSDDQSAFFADYLAQIIADDTFSVSPLRNDVSPPADPNDILYQREAFDYPSTDRQMVSYLTPRGVLPDDLPVTRQPYRFNPVGTVVGPWATGVDRRVASDPWLAATKPTILARQNDALDLRGQIAEYAMKANSWAHISNTSPDGRYVNLANLRLGRGLYPDTSPAYLLAGLAIRAAGNPQNFSTSAWEGWGAERWRPSDWSTNQVGAFRPMVDDLQPSNAQHINNQWADTDGDGYADARWQEAVDWFDPANRIDLLGRNGRYRYFYAARIIDLSGLVNVNTATDFAYAPGYIPPALSGGAPSVLRYYPAGLSPSEIDLRRLLLMGDAFFEFGSAYNGIPQPTPATLAANYSLYRQREATDIGSAGYAALRLAIVNGVPLESNDAVGGSGDYAPAMERNPGRTMPTALNPNPMELSARRSFYSSFGVDPGAPVVFGDVTQLAARSPFGLESELDLRAFNGVNDQSAFSALEATLSGRAAETGTLARMDPLRSNRPRSDEMRERLQSSGTIGASDEARLLDLVDVRSNLTTINGARPLKAGPLSASQTDLLSAGEVAADLQSIKSVLRRVDGTNVVTITSLQPAYTNAAAALFGGAISALAPYHDPNRFAQAWNPTDTQQRTLAYGHRGAELAMRLAAHWLANTIDSMDVDSVTSPSLVTADATAPIAIRVDLVDNLTFTTTDTPFEARDIELKLTSGYDGTDPNVRSPSFMVYGTEPQPFLIEASYYVMFTDARDAAEGSTPDEGDPRGGSGIPGDVPVLEPIQIRRKREHNNGDYLGEILAFQVNNPFEYDVKLTGPLGQPLFYFEHARRYYGLTELDAAGSEVIPQSLELKAGQTRVFYTLSPRTLEQMAARFENALQAAVTSDEVKQMMTAQFGGDAILMPMIDPGPLGNGTVIFTEPSEQGSLGGVNMEMMDLMGEASAGGGVALNGQREVVNLWRVKRSTTNASSRAGDILTDRLHDPNGTNWWFGLVDGLSLASDDVDGTNSIEERTAFDSSSNNDNSGFSVTLWRSVRRPTDRTDVSVVKRGSLPPWCIEAKRDSEYALTLNQADESDGGDPSDPVGDRDDFVDEEGGRFTTLRDMIASLKGSSSKFNDEMDKDAEDKRNNPISLSQSIDPVDGQRRPYDRVSLQMHFIGDDLVTFNGLSARIGRNPMLFSRPADTLMIPAIGASFDLGAFSSAGGDARGEELGWTTLSEAAALASDYFSPSTGVYDSTTAMQLYFRLGHEDAGANERPILRRGALVIDDYTPYLNLDGAPGYNGQFDQIVGAGIPAALSMLDQFRTADYLRGVAYGGLNQSIAGKLNANTAPVQTLRLVPMLAPDPNPTEAGQPWVRLDSGSDLNNGMSALYDPNTNADTWDVAAAIRVYRDKTDDLSRPERFNGNRRRLEFAEQDMDLDDPTMWSARSDRTQIQGLSETPGLRSLGELGVVRVRSDRAGGPGDPQNSIDRMGLDDLALDHPGLSVSSWPKALAMPSTDSGRNETSRDPDEVVDGVDESLAILNAALPSLSVRSDVFCVWFVLNGYLPGDVVDLDDSEPMIPTIRRRYMMIVDRSNVTTVDERPRVLLFKELPID